MKIASKIEVDTFIGITFGKVVIFGEKTQCILDVNGH